MQCSRKRFICIALNASFALTCLSAGWAGWRTFQSSQSGRYSSIINNVRLGRLNEYSYENESEHINFSIDVANSITNVSVANVSGESNPTQFRVEVNITNNIQIPDAWKCSYLLQNIKPTPGLSPLTALASFPRSGNTYTGLLIQIATQFQTNSVYWKTERFKPIKKAFPGVSQGFFKARGICTKTHKHDQKHMSFFAGGAILIVRDPHKSIISNFVRKFRKSGGEKHALELIQANDTQWIEQSSLLAAEWKNTYMDWLHTAQRVLVVPYERLCENTFEELQNIVTFLHQPIKDEQLRCAVNLNPCQCNDWTEFQPRYPEELSGYISELNNTLIKQFSTSLPTYGTKCPVHEVMPPEIN